MSNRLSRSSESANGYKRYRLHQSNMFLIALTNFVFVGSMLLWMVFLWSGALNLVRLNFTTTSTFATPLGWDSLLSLTFFLQHSIMVRRSSRRFLSKFVATEYHGVIFTCTSGVVLSMVVVFWQKSTYIVVAPSSRVIRGLMRTVFVVAIQGLRWAAQSLKSLDVCGLDPLVGKLDNKNAQSPPAKASLIMKGPYRYVRHPFYCCCLVLFWSCPNLSLDRILYNVLWSLWVVIGTLLEERDLVMDFGEAYRDYQRKVPMLIPWLVVRSEKSQGDIEKKSA